MAAKTLFQDFPSVTPEAWKDQVIRDLKGADFDKKLVWKTLDGLEMKPFFTAEDIDAERVSKSARRGWETEGQGWVIREQIRENTVAEANAHVRRAQERGTLEVSVLTYPTGVPIHDQEGMSAFVEGLFLTEVPIHWLAGPFAAQTAAMFQNELARKRIDSVDVCGSVDYDPLLDAATEWTTHGFDGWQERALRFFEGIAVLPRYTWLTIRGNQVEKGGASIAQELAISMALAADYLGLLDENDKDLTDFARHMEFRYAVGSNYLLEIAKLRAHRVLAQNLFKSFGISEAIAKIHVDTTSSNKTLYDPYNNLLRATTESMAAVMGGANSISPAAFDQGYHSPDEFSEHLARNTHHLLREEAFLGKVSDPLGGSYAVEYLTDGYINAAWELFLQIQSHGGFAKAWQCGFLPSEIQRIRQEKSQRVSTGKTPIVGTTVYPNLKERRLESGSRFHYSHRLDNTTHCITELRENFLDGASLKDYESGTPVGDSALGPFRPAWPIEHLRLRMERQVKDGGTAPVILLAQIGDPAMRKARADFCTGFFGIGGYDIRCPAPFKSCEEVVQAVETEKADVLAVCSSNDEYLAVTEELNTLLPEKRPLIIVAGYAGLDIKGLRANDVDDFVHARTDALAFLNALHDTFHITKETL